MRVTSQGANGLATPRLSERTFVWLPWSVGTDRNRPRTVECASPTVSERPSLVVGGKRAGRGSIRTLLVVSLGLGPMSGSLLAVRASAQTSSGAGQGTAPEGLASGTAQPSQNSTFAGQWLASALTETFRLDAWPAQCGPKPAPESSPAGLSLVNEQSGELSFSGLGRPFDTSRCWEQYPGLRRVAHTRGAGAWSSTCKSSETDPRRATVHTNVTAAGNDLLTFRETGDYEFHIGDAKCSAHVTRQRSFTRVSSEVNDPVGGARLVAGASERPNEATSTGGATAVNGATVNGAAVDGVTRGSAGLGSVESTTSGGATRGGERLVRRGCEPVGSEREIRLARPVPWLQPGASYRLTPAIVDAGGCVAAKGTFTYAVEPAVDAVRVGLKSGRIQVSPHAPEGRYTLVIRSGQLREVIEVPVVTREGLAAFLRTPSDAPLGVEVNSPTTTEMLGTSPAAAADTATLRKWWFTGLAGAVILGLGTLGLRLLRAGSRPAASPARLSPLGPSAPTLPSAVAPLAETTAGVKSPTAVSVRPAVASGQLALTVTPEAAPPTPRARPLAPPSETRSNPPPKPRAVEATQGRVCPQCGTRYTDGSLFCGVDGAKLS